MMASSSVRTRTEPPKGGIARLESAIDTAGNDPLRAQADADSWPVGWLGRGHEVPPCLTSDSNTPENTGCVSGGKCSRRGAPKATPAASSITVRVGRSQHILDS